MRLMALAVGGAAVILALALVFGFRRDGEAPLPGVGAATPARPLPTVAESERSGLGTALVNEAIAAAREAGCYKLVATSRASRPKVHALYARLGFASYGLEFRMNLD
jgi:GNAT superfamily N-acetyltransferase